MCYFKINKRSLSGFLILLCVYPFQNSFSQTNNELAKLISLKKGFRVYDLPQSKIPAAGFFVLEPGVAVVPSDGGLFMPAIKKWLMLPGLPGIVSADQVIDKKDSALALIKVDPKNSRILLQKNYALHLNDSSGSLAKMPFGFYDLRVAASNRYYIWGAEPAGSKLYVYDNIKLRMLYNSAKNIKEIDLLDENNVLMIEDNNVLAVSFNQPPKTLLKIDQEIDGIATDSDGSVYISTTKGILHYASLDDDDFDIVTNVIHGKLRIYRGRLFILWKEQGKMVEIKLK
ncbi:hypothetical protein [Sediminibacterium soli]|uniref:hypothetical protein n=1 Tax=Sediminibacterium soli TaxID=2698829 RepID=UPI0013797CC6|nr:hypothetical protein [Sediminibacterium soli]NCI45239.1 hypothetical protein [Sediminibacterium soli]